MRFAYPQMLWLLLLLGPSLVAFLIWAWHRKQTLIAQFVPQRLLPQLTDGISQPRQKLRLALLGLAALCTMLALARPQWGYEWHEVRQRGLDLVIAIDTSRSMLAPDITPTRLARAKLAALDLARLSHGDRLALVPFAGTAYLQCPLTSDFEAFRQNIEVLGPEIMPQGGTALAHAIRIARDALQESLGNDKALVLLTDGEDHDSGALAAAREAYLSGMRIFTVGIGSSEGALLQHVDDSGSPQYVKDPQGNAVLSRLNEPLLQQIAREADGIYLPLASPGAIDSLVQQGLARLTRSDQSTRMLRRFHEQFHWPLSFALLFLLLEFFISERKSAPKLARATAPLHRTTAPIAAALLTLLFIPSSAASPARAMKQFEAGAYEEAEASYQRLIEERGPDPRLHFNRGTAAYRRGDFATAADEFAEAATAQDLALQQRAHYNLGNAYYRLGQQLGDDPQRIEPWKQAVQSYEAALRLQPDDPDTDFNLRFVQEQLDALEPPPQEPDPTPSEDRDNQEQEDNDTESRSQPDSSDAPPEDSDSSGSSQPPEQQPDESTDSDSTPETTPPDSPETNDENTPNDADPNAENQDSLPTSPTGPMTPEEADQLLDAAQQEERPMIFAPPPTSPPSRNLKDW
jgi:Ca-activated chloride channel homolog